MKWRRAGVGRGGGRVEAGMLAVCLPDSLSNAQNSHLIVCCCTDAGPQTLETQDPE